MMMVKFLSQVFTIDYEILVEIYCAVSPVHK